MYLSNEFVLLKGIRNVVHSDKCKCTKKSGTQQCVYGYSKEEILQHCYDIDPGSVIFANCSEIKLGIISK